MSDALTRLIDEQATITIRRVQRSGVRTPEYRALVRMRGDARELERLRTAYGGSVSQERQPSGEPRPTQLWEVAGPRAGALLRAILPELSRQREVAELVIELRDLWETRENRPVAGRPVSDAVIARSDALCEAVSRLNDKR